MMSFWNRCLVVVSTLMAAASTSAAAGPSLNRSPNQPLPKAEDLLVRGLDQVENYEAFGQFDGEMYAGTLPSDNSHDGKNRTGDMMFWLFEPTHQSVPDSLILWLNGGPGCSSFNCGVLMEISPVTQPQHAAGYCCLDSQPEFNYNENTWTRATTILL